MNFDLVVSVTYIRVLNRRQYQILFNVYIKNLFAGFLTELQYLQNLHVNQISKNVQDP